MSIKPRSISTCHALIEKLEKDYKLVNDAYHALANECQAALCKKDVERINMCNSCGRGRAGIQ